MAVRRTIFALLISVAALVRGAEAQNITALRQSIAQAGGRVIVTLKTGSGAAVKTPGMPPIAPGDMDRIEGRLQVTYPIQVHAQLPIIGAVVATVSDADVVRLLADTNVYAIEPDQKNYLTSEMIRTTAARPARIRADVIPWGVTDIGAPGAWAAGLTGNGVKVGIMDTGIDYTHPDLNVVGGFDFNTSSTAPSAYNDTNGSCGGHGTHVAGTVAAKQNGTGVVGVAPNAQLYALKVFNSDGAQGCFAYTSSQIMALSWAATNHLDVVSISIGNGISLAYASAVASANASGVVVVAAAGNSGAPGVTYPAAAPGAVAVAALDPGRGIAGYSSSGPEIWVAAPGSSIESTMPGGGTGYKSGTSMATPHVTGIVALIRQAHPTWTVDQVRTELRNDAVDIAAPGFDSNSGWGIVQAPPTGVTIPVTVALSPAARSVTIAQNSWAGNDFGTVTLSGTNASTTSWSATKKKAWNTFTSSSGTGNGTVSWNRDANGMAAGTYVDTITVTAGSSSAMIFDTLKITGVIVPVTVALSPAARSVSIQQGSAAPSDNATVTLAGTSAGSTSWSATKKKSWTTLTTASGTGSGTVAWSRNTTSLAAGTYVDTITVTAASSVSTVYDTIKVTAQSVVPVAVALGAASRSVTVPVGSWAGTDNASVTLSGTNAATTNWTATKKKSWTTLLAYAGTGNGTVIWTRGVGGLGAGTYVDTITVTAGSVTAIVVDTMILTAPNVAVSIAATPSARSVSVQQGNAAPGDNASITLSGTNAASTSWSATKRQGWLTFTSASGTGDGTLSWTRNAGGLAVGTYVDTITVTAPGAVNSPITLYDTLKITAAPIPVVVALSPAARSVSIIQGNWAGGDNASVTLTGTNAASTSWTATKKKSWTTLTSANGIGSGTVSWTRDANGLGAGTYVDTITVVAGSSSATVFDTLKITAAPIPVVVALSPAARSVSIIQGNWAGGDNASVTLTGTNAASTGWTAVKKKSWTTLTSATGVGNGTVSWTRDANGLGVGTYVDTITVTAGSSSATVFDTLKISAAPVPIVIAVSPASRAVSVVQGTSAPGDNASVTLSGTNAQSAARNATNRKPWLTLTSASGTGSGTITWTRNASGLGVGTYVDTITVTAVGATNSPVTIFDTLRITAAPIPVMIAVSPAARSATAQQNAAAPGDNATVTLTGTNAPSTVWSATKKKSWTTLTTASGTGSGSVVWTRNTSGLGVGTYVDTITVVASGVTGSPAMVFDTLKITAIPVPVALAVSPIARKVSVQQGNAAPGDNAAVQLSGTNASTTAWSATKRQAWTTLSTGSGTGSGTVSWNRNTAGLGVGTYVDTIVVSTAVTPAAMVFDTLVITAAPVPVVIAVSPAGRSVSVQQGNGAPGDFASVTLTGTNAASTPWSATNRKNWLTFSVASGTGSGTISWNRNSAGLGVGTYVDTITVTSPGITGSPTYVYDTLKITAIPVVPVVMAVSPTVRSISVPQGTAAPGDNASVTLTGTFAASTAWASSHTSAPWATFTSASGIGSGTLSWDRSTGSLLPGIYVDTITVSIPSTGQWIRVYDSVVVTAVAPTIIVTPNGKKSRSVSLAGSSLASIGVDSAIVQGFALDSLSGNGWTAAVSNSRLVLTTPNGAVSDWVKWSRPPQALTPGMYVDTVAVWLTSSPSVRAVFVDSLEVVAVAIPVPDIAVGDLFDHRSLSDDQRVALDRQGNSNGRYDLGDFLAWVTRNHIKLSPAAAQKVKQASALKGSGGN